MKWCCGVFKGWFDEAGNRGLSVVVGRNADGTPAFMLQHRSTEPDDDGPKDHPRPITLASEIQISYCPWCGCRLENVYRKSIDLMIRPGLRNSILEIR
ncbi:MAG: hypothetical protein DIJKHBIC_03693 [Thermoanaerobaculia bacterium]|nr:hypothetical protein [Thermoanaerobaculia bacterium]